MELNKDSPLEDINNKNSQEVVEVELNKDSPLEDINNKTI